MGLGPRFMFSPLRAPHCVFCTFRCGLLFDFGPFLYSSLVPLRGVFQLFIYLDAIYGTVHTNKVSPPPSFSLNINTSKFPTSYQVLPVQVLKRLLWPSCY
jgi:hypothetical protein